MEQLSRRNGRRAEDLFRLPRGAFVLFGAVPLIGIIGWLDVATGPDIGFSLFYLIPIVVTALIAGAMPAMVAATTAAVTWLMADIAAREIVTLPISTWNGLTRLVIFMILGWAVAKLRDDRLELRRLNRRLEDLLSHEAGLARTNALTGLANSRAFLEDLAAMSSGRFAIAYIDLDNFKRVNDGFGHAAGDSVLQQVGQCLAGSLRERDSSARLGGDEFAVLLRDVAPDDAEAAVRRLVERIAEIGRGYPGAALGASAGLALFESHPGAEAALRAADHAMYQAKQAGKSRVIVTRPGA